MKSLLTVTLAGLRNICSFREILEDLSLALDVLARLVEHDHIAVLLANALRVILFLVKRVSSLMRVKLRVLILNV